MRNFGELEKLRKEDTRRRQFFLGFLIFMIIFGSGCLTF